MFRPTLFAAVALAALASLSPRPAIAVPAGSILIVDDVFADSAAPTANYGADPKVKATSNGGSSMFPFDPVTGTGSITHVFFTLPQSFWDAVGSGPVASATVSFFPINNSINTTGAISDLHNNVELHPLTAPFTVGNGLQTSLVNGNNNNISTPSTTGGATWLTSDGTTPWQTPGGDFDAANFVSLSDISPPNKGSVPFVWDITSLINDPTTRAELQSYGALLKVINEDSFSGNDFTSLYSADYASTTGLPPTADDLTHRPYATILLPGDTNGDGVVDLTDLNNVLNNFGVTSPNNPGDNNGDGTVDLSDLNEVLNHFGLGSPAPATLAVPEPAAVSLLALPLLLRRRRRNSR